MQRQSPRLELCMKNAFASCLQPHNRFALMHVCSMFARTNAHGCPVSHMPVNKKVWQRNLMNSWRFTPNMWQYCEHDTKAITISTFWISCNQVRLWQSSITKWDWSWVSGQEKSRETGMGSVKSPYVVSLPLPKWDSEKNRDNWPLEWRHQTRCLV